MTLTTKEKRRLLPTGEWTSETVYLIDRREVSKADYDKALKELTPRVRIDAEPIARKRGKRAWPIESVAAGVHRNQIHIAKKLDKARGAPPTEYSRAGNPIFTSHYHRKAWLKANRMIDRNSYC